MQSKEPSTLRSCLRAVYRREQSVNLTKGLLALFIWLIALFLLCFLIDWLIRLPSLIRMVVLIFLLALPSYKAWQIGWRFLTSFSLARSALTIEKHYKHFESLLVTGVQLWASAPASGTSQAMAERTILDADKAAGSVDVQAVVPLKGLRNPALTTGLLSVAVIGIAVMNLPLFTTALARLFTPWQDVDYPTRTQMELDNPPMIVKEGDSLQIRAHLAGQVPGQAQLLIRTGEGEPNNRTLDVIDDTCSYEMAAVFRSFDYALRAGDADSGWRSVTVVTSPQVVGSQVRITYPAYMNRETQMRESMTLAVPEGAHLEWDLKLDQPVSDAAFRLGNAAAIGLEISADGRRVRHALQADASDAYSLSWVEKQHGYRFNSSKYYLQVIPDQPPKIEMILPNKNLFATVGRKLDLKVRASDDHGLAEMHVVYRLNQLSEKRAAVSFKSQVDRELQTIDWDYREALIDLEIGDTMSFAIEVADGYPSTQGPHRARSESRRVTFLSEEDYLTKVAEQKQRLLSQLRSIYRQQRAASEMISSLNPKNATFEQTCFLESSRQEMIRERIANLRTGLQGLADDLSANHINDPQQYAELEALRVSLAQISDELIGPAANQLRDLAPSGQQDLQEVEQVASTINNAARELSKLVLRLGVDEAMEVFGRELHVIAKAQSLLRVESIDGNSSGADFSKDQEAIAVWMNTLLNELDTNLDYTTSPLRIVRLSRLIKDTRAAGVVSSMQDAAALLETGKQSEAIDLQHSILVVLSQLEAKARVGAEREALIAARDLFKSGASALEQAVKGKQPLSAKDADLLLTDLNRQLRLLIVPQIPAPPLPLLVENPTPAPPLDRLLLEARESLQQALLEARASKISASREHQLRTAQSFAHLHAIIVQRLDHLNRSGQYAGYSGASMERSALVREIYSRQMRITEKTEDAEYDEISAAYLAPSQAYLGKEVLAMQRRLERLNEKPSIASRVLAPMLVMLEDASDSMAQSAPALRADDLDVAIEQQDLVLNALESAMSFSTQEANAWVGLANLVMTTEGVQVPAGLMHDIVAEQQDLIEATRHSTPKTRDRLLQIQKNLGLAVFEVSELVSGTGSALDFEQAMIFAGSDMGLSAIKLESGEVAEAMGAQRLAADSVRDLSEQFDASVEQYAYFVIALEFLQDRHIDSVVLQAKLKTLRAQVQAVKTDGLSEHADALATLHVESKTLGGQLMDATGREIYLEAHNNLSNALNSLAAGEADACVDDLLGAEDALQASLQELRELMVYVAFVPSVDPIEAPPEYNVMLEMVDLLVLQRQWSPKLYDAEAEAFEAIGSRLRDMEETAGDLLQSTDNHALIAAAQKALADAHAQLKTGDRDAAYASLLTSETKLRQCVLEYALYYIELPRSMGGKRTKKGKSGIVDDFKLTLKIKPAYDKDYGGVEGEDPRSGRSEWEVLGSRDRAALHENFVRELPLEFRGFLQNYYERLAK